LVLSPAGVAAAGCIAREVGAAATGCAEAGFGACHVFMVSGGRDILGLVRIN
jgi:hypothetical protein